MIGGERNETDTVLPQKKKRFEPPLHSVLMCSKPQQDRRHEHDLNHRGTASEGCKKMCSSTSAGEGCH